MKLLNSNIIHDIKINETYVVNYYHDDHDEYWLCWFNFNLEACNDSTCLLVVTRSNMIFSLYTFSLICISYY